MLTNKVYRFDRVGAQHFVTSDETKKALAVLRASILREERDNLAALKVRQEANNLTLSERMLCSIFGEIK